MGRRCECQLVGSKQGPGPANTGRRADATRGPGCRGASQVRAKSDGTWTALDAVEQLVEPDDLSVRLDRDKKARAEWGGFPPSAKRAILGWLGT